MSGEVLDEGGDYPTDMDRLFVLIREIFTATPEGRAWLDAYLATIRPIRFGDLLK